MALGLSVACCILEHSFSCSCSLTQVHFDRYQEDSPAYSPVVVVVSSLVRPSTPARLPRYHTSLSLVVCPAFSRLAGASTSATATGTTLYLLQYHCNPSFVTAVAGQINPHLERNHINHNNHFTFA